LLEVKNLTAGIKSEKKILKAVKDISFTIAKGEVVGLAGESGCGKSTTALAITNLLPYGFNILYGDILFDKKSLIGKNTKNTGIIFQDSIQALNPLMRVGRQIIENLEQKTENREQKKENKEKVIDILIELGFKEPDKIFEAFPHQLSGGMCQRIMTAIAAISNPHLIIADEPSSSLDEESQKCVLSFLMKMNRENKTSILIISHDLSIIRQYCSRIMIMYAGKIIEEGKTELLSSPRHPYTRALINAVPSINKRGKKLETISGKVPSINDEFSGCSFVSRCSKAQSICFNNIPAKQKQDDNHSVWCHFPAEGCDYE